ncbi:MAG: restriction endonuclease subunit S [Proteobacteria bacterium]|nr:restriction endonuclease subunit S [Pseudomonadota bacterium]
MRRWPRVALGEVIRHRKEFITIEDSETYKLCRVQLHAKGVVLRNRQKGADIRTKKQQMCRAGDFLVAEIDAKMGGFGLVPDELDGAIVSSHYFLFEADHLRLDRRYLDYFCRTEDFRGQVTAQGTTNYAAIRPADVLAYEVPLPSLAEQQAIVARLDALADSTHRFAARLDDIEADADALTLALHRRLADGREVSLSEIIELHEESVPIRLGEAYPQVGVRSFGGGLFAKPAVSASDTTYRAFNRLYLDALVLSQVKGWEGAIAVTPHHLAGMFASPEYRTFRCLPGRASPRYLGEIVKTPWFWSFLQNATRGVGARRERTRPEQFLKVRLSMPTFRKQVEAVDILARTATLKSRHAALRESNTALLPATLERVFSSAPAP